MRPRCDPLLVGLELQSKLWVVDQQISVAPALHRHGEHCLHFLRHDADVDLVAAVVAETIETKSVIKAPQQRDVVLQSDIGMVAATVMAAAMMAATMMAATVVTAAAVTAMRRVSAVLPATAPAV